MKTWITLSAMLVLLLCGRVTASDLDHVQALDQGPAGAAATARVLADYHRRSNGEQGFAWWMRLPIAVRAGHAQAPAVLHWRNRVEFLRDAQRADPKACAVSGAVVLRDPDLECDYAVELQRLLDCVAALPSPRRSAFLATLDPDPGARLSRDARVCPELVVIDAARQSLDTAEAGADTR